MNAMTALRQAEPEPTLCGEVDAFIRRYGLAKTKFGELAVNSLQFVDNLRAGRKCGADLERRVRDFMAKGDPGIAMNRKGDITLKQRRTADRNAAAALEAVSFRMTDEAEQAKTFLRRQHLTVFNAEIINPKALGRFMIGTRCVSRDELIETARRRGWKES